MNFRVVWRSRVADRLDLFQFLAGERGRDLTALPNAIAQINLQLSDDPSNCGESRSGAERVLIVSPLTVIYEVFEDAGVVLVYSAVYSPRMRA
jgi:hypothetical protein